MPYTALTPDKCARHGSALLSMVVDPSGFARRQRSVNEARPWRARRWQIFRQPPTSRKSAVLTKGRGRCDHGQAGGQVAVRFAARFSPHRTARRVGDSPGTDAVVRHCRSGSSGQAPYSKQAQRHTP